MTREELIQKYVDNQKQIERINKENSEIKKEINLTFEHKVGEIVKWVEKERRKNVGNLFHPKWEILTNIERVAVLTNITPSIQLWDNGNYSFCWRLEFKPIKKDGGISMNGCHVNIDNIQWTGYIHKSFQTKE